MTTSPDSRRMPLYLKVIIGVLAGTAVGLFVRATDGKWVIKVSHLSQLAVLGTLFIKLLKALAVPLILFAILDAFIKTSFSVKQGVRLVGVCLLNVTIAMTLGLTLMNTFKPGERWAGQIQHLRQEAEAKDEQAAKTLAVSHTVSLNFWKNLEEYVPETLVGPLTKTAVIPVVLVALLIGPALRRVRHRQQLSGRNSIAVVEQLIEATYETLVHMLEWIVQLVPYAVFLVLAKVVAESGPGVFKVLWIFLVAMLAGLLLHSLVYYPLMAWLVGRKHPRVYLGIGSDAIMTSLSFNSSLATVPVTLKCLDRMGVSPRSARLGTCIGTQLNNDGIALYEAMAAIFMAQALGMGLGLPQQLTIVMASIMAGAGIAGIPEAGLVMLPLVLGSAGLSETQIAGILPLIMTVDWIIARVRSGVNVMADMLVSILMDV